MKICFMGSMEFAVPILEGLNEKFQVSLVVTQPDKPVGRKQILKGTPIKEKALELGIELFQPISIKKDNQRILQEDFDFIIVAAYGQLIPEKVLYHSKYQAINVHASLLPKYRGGSPMHKAIINGDKETGISIIYMEKALDSGLILSQEACEITLEDNVKTLETKLSYIGKDLLLDTLEKLMQGKIKPFSQEESKVTYAYNFKKDDLIIDFNLEAQSIYNFVRGLNPWPIAHFIFNGQMIKVFETDYCNDDMSDNIGEIVKIDKDGLHIQTKSGVIILKTIQLQGKKQMPVKDFMNGVGKSMFYEGLILN